MDEEKSIRRKQNEQIFDGCFHVSAFLCKELLIPLTNEAFQMNIPKDAQIVFRSELQLMQGRDGKLRKRVVDVLISFKGVPGLGENTKFHFECESRAGNIILRIVEYALQEGIKSSEKADDGSVDVHIPRSAVIYLQSNHNTPRETSVRLHTPGGGLQYPVPSILLKEYSMDEIFEKELFILIPFYLLRYRNKQGKMEAESGITAALEERLDSAIEINRITENTADRIRVQLYKVEEYLYKKEDESMDNTWEKDWYVIDDPQFYMDEGSEWRLIDLICKKLQKGKGVQQIADEVEEDEIRVQMICEIAESFSPGYDTKKVFDSVQKELVKG